MRIAPRVRPLTRLGAAVLGVSVVAATIQVAPTQAATGGTPPPPPPNCTLFGTAHGTDLRAELELGFNVDLAPGVSSTSAAVVMDGYPHFTGSLSNASPTAVSDPTVAFDSGLDPAEFVTRNSQAPLTAFPYACGIASLTTGQQLQNWGIVRRGGTPPGERVTRSFARDHLGYDSSRTVDPPTMPADGGVQTVTLAVTPRDVRFDGWSWISPFVSRGPNDTLVSFTPPSNLDAGERLHSLGGDGVAVEGAVLNKTYVFSWTIRYANPFGRPWTHLPGADIWVFTQVTPCNFCVTGPSASLAIPQLDGPTPGRGRATFSISETTHTWFDVATKRSYHARYAHAYWPDINASVTRQLNADQGSAAIDAVSGATSFLGYPTWTFHLGTHRAATSPTLTVNSGYPSSSLIQLGGPSAPVSALPIVEVRPSLAAGGNTEFRPITGPDITVAFDLGYDSSRVVTPLVVPVGGGDQTLDVTVTPTASDISDFHIGLFDNIPGVSLVSFAAPPNLDQGERLFGPNTFGGVASWGLGNVRTGKSYTLRATIRVPNPFGVPFSHKPSWHLFAGVQLPDGCAGCGGPASSVTLPEPTLDGETPGAGSVTFSVAEDSLVWEVRRQVQRVVRYSSTRGSRLDSLAAVRHGPDLAVSARLTFGKFSTTPPAGETITFTLGTGHCSGITGLDGRATCTMPVETTGGATLFASYAGNAEWYPSTASIPVTLAPCPSARVVTNTNDSGPCSLRAAIEFANAHAGPDTVTFAIPATDPGFNGQWFTIRPLSPLPWLTDGGTTIDGSTQGETNPFGPSVVINGSLAGGGSGLTLSSDHNRVHRLVVNGFVSGGGGIDVRGSNNIVTGSYVGTDATGTTSVGNRHHGINIFTGTGNVIGGSSPSDRNVISGNNGQGVAIHSARNYVRGNFIGTDRTGTIAIANGLSGVFIWPCHHPECAGPAPGTAAGNIIGGSRPGERNVISGNQQGIWVQDIENVVQGNFIGTDVAGSSPLGNATGGVALVSSPAFCGGKGAPSTLCHPGSTADRNRVIGNVISANGAHGLEIISFSESGVTSDENVVQGNYIGTDATGSAPLGNVGFGLRIRGGTNNLIGGTTAGARNIISANGLATPRRSGLHITSAPGTSTTGNVVQGNYIGTDAAGTTALGNGRGGVTINFASGNTIGGSAPGARNVISGNESDGSRNVAGIAIAGPVGNPCCADTVENAVIGNYVGTDATGTFAVPNLGHGIAITGGASRNVIGGSGPGEGNLISGNAGTGVPTSVHGWSGIFIENATETSIQGNLIGTDASGALAVPNAGGIDLINADRSVVGGTALAARNVISGNRGSGIRFGGTTADTTIQGNHIGTDAAGNVPLPNEGNGIFFKLHTAVGPHDNVIGGSAPGAGNVISGNRGTGVLLGGTRNFVEGNWIGTARTGSAIPNGNAGIAMADTSIDGPGHVIGGQLPGSANVIAHNGGPGIAYFGNGPAQFRITQNEIFANGGLGIDLRGDGVTPNDAGDADTGPNGLQNFPVLYMALPAGDGVVVRGFVDSPNPGTITVELFGNDAADPSGHGEGQRYAGTVMPNANGCFTLRIDASPAGSFVTATATDAAGNTSEFSAALAVRPGRPATIPPRCGG